MKRMLMSCLFFLVWALAVSPVWAVTLDLNGWSDPTAGTWDADTLTAVLTKNLSESVTIGADNITLDGAGYSVRKSGTTSGNGIYISQREGITVKNVNIENFSRGIFVTGSNNCNISWNIITTSTNGIQIQNSKGITVTGNTVRSGTNGIYLNGAFENTITGNFATNHSSGIKIQSGSGNTIAYNTASRSYHGIIFESADNNFLTGNISQENIFGIQLSDSTNNLLTENSMSGNNYSFTVVWKNVSHFYNEVCTSNSVDEKPVYYLKDAVGLTLDAATDAGVVYLINCSQITISGLNVSNNTAGIYLWNTHNSIIENVLATENSSGIRLTNSNGNLLQNNILLNNNNGIYINNSADTTVSGNNAFYNNYGIFLDGATCSSISGNAASSNVQNGFHIINGGNNTVRNNTSAANKKNGIEIRYSNNNLIYNNNFINNRTQAVVASSSGNIFSLPWPAGGNYWSDRDATMAYVFTGGQDYFPWDNEDGWIDDIPPETSASVDGSLGNYGWYVSPVTVTLSATDNEGGSGVAFTEYSINETDWLTYSGPITVCDIVTTIFYRSADNENNIEESKYLTIKSDTKPPMLSIRTPEPYAVLPVGTVMDFDADDILSGLLPHSLIGILEQGLTAVAVNYDSILQEAGVYTLTVTAKDLAGNTAEETRSFVVYDPDGGFVTGSGWLDSPAGALAADVTLTGKATFGFVAKYHKGASVPEGRTVFHFRAGDLHFHSTDYEWLVVSGSKAQFKGSGTINGTGGFGFILTAIDGRSKGTGDDRFRVKIWDKTSGFIVYDNRMGDEEASDNSLTVLGGGSIVIHRK